MLEDDEKSLVPMLDRMNTEARETQRRCTEVAGGFKGKKTAILEKGREVKGEALPIQQRHFQEVLDGSLELAAGEDPEEIAE